MLNMMNPTAKDTAEILAFAAMRHFQSARKATDMLVKQTWLAQAEHCANLAEGYKQLAKEQGQCK